VSSGSSSPRAELAASLREVLLDPADAAALDVHGRTDAAVLVPLFLRDGDLHAVFTRRRDDMRRHPGEISFPGGREDPGDADLTVTALREAEEEIGLDRTGVELVGALQPTPTIATNYAVYPFVGLIEPGLEWTLSAREVAQVLELSLNDLRAATAGSASSAAASRSAPTSTSSASTSSGAPPPASWATCSKRRRAALIRRPSRWGR
jgi:8-oxo-dGTP pyrophosphatase MutT (NUDIX family)